MEQHVFFRGYSTPNIKNVITLLKKFENLHILIHKVIFLGIINLVFCIAPSVLIESSLKLADEGDRDMLRVMSSRLMNVVDIE